MNVRFLGAVREVTGSMHVVESGEDRIMLDCGMFQGKRQESTEKNNRLLIDPQQITNVVLSHAHIDHVGRFPLLVKKGYNGQLICSRATADAAQYLLLDAAHIQESDANYLNYKLLRKYMVDEGGSLSTEVSVHRLDKIKKELKRMGHHIDSQRVGSLMAKRGLAPLQPLYTIADAELALKLITSYPYNTPVQVGESVMAEFFDAGHILGSSFVMLRIKEGERNRRVLFSGDMGRFIKPILRDPTLKFADADREIDLLIIESTYGNRLHEEVSDLKPHLKAIINQTLSRGGSVLVPAFAFGRTQELLYTLHELQNNGDIPRVPIFVDSPLASKLTRVYGEHPEVYDQNTHHTFLEKGQNPFYFSSVHFVESIEESMQLNRSQEPHIVLSASGMCEAGRILHHLRYKIHDARHTILIVGFMAEHTLGRKILELGTAYQQKGRKGPVPLVKILGKEYPLRAQVLTMPGFSAHADQNELLRFMKEANLSFHKVAVVHGEEEQSQAFRDRLVAEGYDAFVPQAGENYQI